MPWKYETDETPKRKHRWAQPLAGFEAVGTDKFVAKCPSTLSIDDVEILLEGAIPWSPRRWTSDYPKRLYAVLDGVLYRGTPTNPGVSYHGFPEYPSRFPGGASNLKRELIERASELGCEEGLRQWMNW